MKKTILRTYREELSFHERLEQELSAYPEKTIHTDGSINVKHVNNPYLWSMINGMLILSEISNSLKSWRRIIITQLKISILKSKALRLIWK